MEVIEKIKSYGVKTGITIKPKTPVSTIEPYLGLVDLVLVMTVEPGFGGQKLMPDCLKKVTELKELRDKNGYKYEIEADGGSAVFGAEDIHKAAKDMLDIIREYD